MPLVATCRHQRVLCLVIKKAANFSSLILHQMMHLMLLHPTTFVLIENRVRLHTNSCQPSSELTKSSNLPCLFLHCPVIVRSKSEPL